MTRKQVVTVNVTEAYHPYWALLINWKRIVMLLCALMLLVAGFQLIRSGASSFSFLLTEWLIHQNPIHTLGLGWLASSLLLSGPPVVAASLTLFDSGELSKVQTFTMIVGTRLGTIFVTLMFGLLYYAQGKHTKQGLAVGVLAYLTTFWLALGSLLIGFLLLPTVNFHVNLSLFSSRSIDRVFEPFGRSLTLHLPPWAVITNGVAWLMLSFKLADLALPDLGARKLDSEKPVQLRSPLVMFLLGLGVALLSPSVTVSCSLLFPFYAKGYLGAGRFVPYVMGANVSTFSGTLLAALPLPSVAALQVMTAELISVGVVSLMILLAGFSKYKRMIESWMDYFTESPTRLAQFLVLTFFVPVVLLIV